MPRARLVLYAFAVVFITCFSAWGAGITVPSGFALNIKDNQINVAGDVSLGGTVTTTTGIILFDGSWTTSGVGTYLAGTGTVRLTGTAADPDQVITPGTALGDGFYNFIHEGTGTARLATNRSHIYGNFTNSAGTFNANSVDMAVYGNWNNAAAFNAGTGSVILLGTDQGIYGSTTFYNLSKQLTSPVSRRLTLQNTVEQKVENNLTLVGYDSSIYLVLRSDVDATAARLTLNKAGQQNIRYVDVKDNNASGYANGTPYVTPVGMTLIGRISPDHTSDWNNTNWLFNGVAIKWDGSNCTGPTACLWNDPYNWDLGLVPGEGDTAIIRSVDEDNSNAPIAYQPVLTSDVQVTNLEVRAGAGITLDQHNLTVDSTITNNGNLILDGNETVRAATLTNNGTFTYVGSQLGALNADMTHNFLINSSYLTTFYNLVINEDPAITMHGTFITTAPITVTHNLSVAAGNVIPAAAVAVTNDTAIYGGTLDISTHAVTLTTASGLAVSAGTLNAQGGSIDAKDVTISGTTAAFSAPSSTRSFTVSGNFTNTATPSSAFNAHDGTVVLDGTDQAIYGQTTFYSLTKAIPGAATLAQTLTFESGKEQTVTHMLTMTGLDDGSALTHALNLQASVAGTPALLTLASGGGQVIRDVSVTDSNAGSGLALIARGFSPDHSDFATYHNTKWFFGGVTLKWDGSGSPPGGADATNWDNQYNWDLGVVPQDGDTVIIRSELLPAEAATEGISSIGAQPHLATAVNIAALTLREANTTLNLDAHNLTVTGALTNNGNIIAQGSEAIRITTLDTQHGTFTYVGNDTNPASPKVLKLAEPSVNPIRYYNLVIADTGTAETFTLDTDAAVYGSLSVSGGALNLSSWNVEVDGGLYLSGTGTVTAPGAGRSFKVAAAFSNTAGSSTAFVANSGTVTLDGVDQAIYGSTDFYNLTKAIPIGATQAQTLTFPNGQKQTVEHLLTLTGMDNGTALTYPLYIRATSSTDPRPQLVLKPGGAQVIRDVDVQDNDASPDNGVTLVARGFSPDHSAVGTYHAVNWAFGSTTLKWDGSGTPPGSTDPADWNNPYNWDRGLVPQAGDTVVIRSQLLPAEVTAEGISSIGVQPHLTAAVNMGDLTLRDSGSILTLDGHDVTATGSLTNYGNIIARGSENIRIAIPDTQHGTFTYTGNDTAPLAKVLKLADPSTNPLQYYNLVIADTGTVETFAPDIDLAVYGSLTVSGGILNLAARNVDVNGSVAISGGNLTAPAAGLAFTVGAGWSNSGGLPFFTANGGRVTFDTSVDASIYGNTTFNDMTLFVAAGKTVYFAAGSDQTVLNDLTMGGSQSHKLVLRSTVDGSPWTITVPSEKIVTDVDVKNSIAAGPLVTNIFALNSIDQKNSSGNSTNIGWAFGNLRILYPADGTTVGQVPVIIGQGIQNGIMTIVDKTGAVVATTKGDVNGNFRVVLGRNDANLTPNPVTKTALDISAIPLDRSLAVVYQTFVGSANNLTVVTAPTVSQVPVITSPVENDRIAGSRPTIQGEGAASAAVIFIANDADGNLLLTLPPDSYAGQGTSGADGKFSTRLTTSLPRGTIYISAIVNGVSSPLMTYTIYGLHGVVFDSSSVQPLKDASISVYKSDGKLAVPNIDLDPADKNPFVTGADGAYHFMPENGSYYIVVSSQGYKFPTKYANTELPSDHSIITGSRGEVFPITAAVTDMDLPLDATDALFKIEKDANKSEAKIGEVVTYSVTIESLSSSNTILKPKLYDVIPPGFKYINGRVLLDSVPLANPTGNRPLTFEVGDFTPRQKKTLRYQLIIGSGVVPGTYENTAYMKYANGLVISNVANKAVKVVVDPLFDLGTVFGKVFYDYNDNGRQDEPDYIAEELRKVVEGPVPNVRIVMEDGTIVTTDKNGQFHIPQLLPGRHLLRVDERTLPPGAYVTTDKVQVIDVTAGSIIKLNFGINFDNAQVVGDDARFFQGQVRVEQDTDTPKTKLNVDMFNTEILLHNDAVIEQLEFRIFMNYAPFIQSWRLDVVDKDTKKLVRSFSGTPVNIRDPIYWDGRDNSGHYIRADRHYSYYLKVEDDHRNWDETVEKDIAVRSLTDQEWDVRNLKKDEKALTEEMKDRAKTHRAWLASAAKVDATRQQNIKIFGETVRIDPLEANLRQVRVLKDGQLYIDVPLVERHALTAMELIEGGAQKADPVEIILPNGDYELEVVNAEGSTGEVGVEGIPPPPNVPKPDIAAAGEQALKGGAAATVSPSVADLVSSKVTHYKKPVKVGEDQMMFIAMGDGKFGYNIDRGNIEPVQASDKYRPGFYHEGKMAYYLKGKIKGKYIITSSFDSERQQKEMFRGLKEDAYYPIYGDSSTLNYDATNTQGPLYLLVEWDKSQAIWGNYAVDFNNTDFAKYTRTLYGGKIDYTSVASTKFGDPRTKIAVFHSQIRQRSSHNELLGTGGSLYYLKHRDVVPGSDTIKVEVRDAITGQVKSSTSMKEGVDYKIDCSEGRILFWQPVSMSADKGSIISNNLLSGDPVYVIVDYEYYVNNMLTESTKGTRVAQAVTDNVTVGGTYVSETQTGGTYQLQGEDVTIKMSRDSTVRAEYAETQSQDAPQYISTDGGITFSELARSSDTQGRAYGLSHDARLFDRIGLASYYKWVDPGFSTAGTTSQQGKELKGINLTFDLTPVTRLSTSYDIQRLIEQGNLQTQMQVGAQETRTTVMQLVHQARRLRLTWEFRNQQVRGRSDKYVSEANQDKNTAAFQAQYVLNEKTDVTLTHQADFVGKGSQQTALAFRRQVTDDLVAKLEESFGSIGTGTKAGLTANVNKKLALSTEYGVMKYHTGERVDTSTVGLDAQVGKNFSMKTAVSQSVSSSGTKDKTATASTDGQVTSNASQTRTGQTVSVATKGQVTDNLALETTAGVTRSADGTQRGSASVLGTTSVDNANVKAGVESGLDKNGVNSQAVTFGASRSPQPGMTTSSDVKLVDSAIYGKETVLTLTQQGQLGPTSQLSVERSFGFGRTIQEKTETYKVAQMRDGRKLETSWGRNYAEKPAEHSSSNIFGLTGDINDKWAANVSIEQGKVQNADGSVTNRLALAGGAGYVRKDVETGTVALQSSTKVEGRFDSGGTDKTQYLVSHATEGRVTEETTLTGKFEFSQTRNNATNSIEARYKEIVLGVAYRPINNDRLNLFGKYTYKDNVAPQGQANSNDIEASSMQVLTAEGAYDLNDDWQIVERLAYRIMEEKVAGFDFYRTHTWLLVNRLNYRMWQDWKVGGEYRVLTQREAQDQKHGFLVEATHSVNNNLEIGIGYNFTQFIDDLTNLDYTVAGPFVRMTGKLYDRTPEERTRARAKWIDRRVEYYAWKMVGNELKKSDSPIFKELKEMYRTAGVANSQGDYEGSRRIYKDVILGVQMMFEEAAQFVRKHISFEEKLYNAHQRAREYYDKGDYWMAKKIWEKIVEEASKAMLK